MASSWTTHRAQLGQLGRQNVPANDPRVIEARRALRAELLAEHIARVVAEAPPLTDEQRDRLALLLQPTNTRSGAAA